MGLLSALPISWEDPLPRLHPGAPGKASRRAGCRALARRTLAAGAGDAAITLLLDGSVERRQFHL